MPRQAGVILLGTSGVIPPNKVEHMETACTINEDKVIHPFAFRTHTHSLGTEVSGFVVRRSRKGDIWELLGSKNPQLPQMFYPVVSRTPITTNDVLAARCVMNNTHTHAVSIGATHKDEMCNFYLMYWVQDDSPLEQKYCFSPGPPYYYWSRAPQNFDRIPGRDFNVLQFFCVCTKCTPLNIGMVVAFIVRMKQLRVTRHGWICHVIESGNPSNNQSYRHILNEAKVGSEYSSENRWTMGSQVTLMAICQQ
ncbi:jg20802 [Pararge aegeria aegeria]|uniref:peptidylglycine monooxygenase n=1 Tax=Pararge aegeria aegeria TaxID=348720 RepID=A0A8S4R6B6_9NEOP|nr:jg20802 [Pararge aegeria aegeria]